MPARKPRPRAHGKPCRPHRPSRPWLLALAGGAWLLQAGTCVEIAQRVLIRGAFDGATPYLVEAVSGLPVLSVRPDDVRTEP